MSTLTIYLPDVNVWIAFAVDAYPHHLAAKRWFDVLGKGRIVLCRVTEQFDSDARIMFAAEPDGVEEVWRATARAGEIGCFCARTGATMVTFDRAFGRRTPCKVLLLDAS